jgi:molybdopterin-binding protein
MPKCSASMRSRDCNGFGSVAANCGARADAQTGATMRVQILARDVIVATEEPHGLSVRNRLRGTVTVIQRDDAQADQISIDIGGATLLARITDAATRELGLRPGMPAWALIKSVSLRGRSIPSRRTYFVRVPRCMIATI